MARIDYEKIGFSMTEKGREIREIAAHHDESIKKSKYYAYDSDGHYAVSRKATHELIGDLHYIPGNSQYKNPALQLALAFAIKNNDKKLIRALEKMDKYCKASYEAYYGAYNTALKFYERGERASESIRRKQETLEFIIKYSSYTNSELRELRKQKQQKLSLINSDEYKRELESEIELLNQLIQMTERKRKKFIIAKGKEIEEIIKSAKNNKSYKNRYIKYMRAAHKKSRKLSDGEIGEYYSMAYEIIRELGNAIKPQARGYSIDKFEVDQYMLENIENELRTKYYPGINTKTK